MRGQESAIAVRARSVWSKLTWGWGELRRQLGAKGLWPQVARLAATPNGAVWRISGDRCAPISAGVPEALMIPSSDVLWGSFTVPDVSSAALDGAVTEALWRASPLPLDQVAVAWRAQPNDPGGWQVTWGVCPSHQVSQGLAQLQLPEGAPVYLADEGGTALLIRGSVWDGHRRAQRRLDMLAAGGVALVTVALLAPMAMPLVLKRQAVVRAMAHMETVEPMASSVRKKLDELHGLSKLAEGLVAERQDSLPLASALDRLAEALPSDAWLDRLEASDRQVRIMGLTPNATELMGRLNRVAEFSELRSTAPTVRDEGQNRERFSVEFSWRDASSGAVGK